MLERDYRKLKQKLEKDNFNKNYKTTNIVLKFLSYFGNISSIFLSYFFLFTLLSIAISSGILATIVTVIILVGLELLKRDIFDKLSTQILTKGTIIPLLISSLILISLSFYSTLTGANIFVSKSDEIEETRINSISNYTDSINAIYSNKIELIENEIQVNKSLILKKDEEQEIINKDLLNKGWITSQQRNRNEQLNEDKKYLNTNIEKLENNIKDLKDEYKTNISEYELTLNEDIRYKKDNNSKNTLIFVLFSTLIELTILCGIYFNKYYNIRSFNEAKKEREKNPKYQTWLKYNNILESIYLTNTKINQKLPSNASMLEMCHINGHNILAKDMTDFIKLLINLDIVKHSGSARYINKTRDVSFMTLQEYFEIN